MIARYEREGRLQRDSHGETIPWLCPTDPRNQALEINAVLEIVQRYDVAGVHLDYIRYPREACCFCPTCRAAFQGQVGVDFKRWPQDLLASPLYARFRLWRQDQITGLVKTIHDGVHRTRPGALVSAAVVPDWDGDRWRTGQNWLRWVQDGDLDFVCPMDYSTNEPYLRKRLQRQVDLVGGRVPVYPGLGSWMLQDVTNLGDQMRLARASAPTASSCFTAPTSS